MKRRFAVIFGRKQPDAAVLKRLQEARQGEAVAGARIFEPGSAPPLRLCSDDRVRFPPSVLADIPDTARKVARLKADVSRDMDVFAKNPRRLLDLYFAFIAARLEAEGATLEELLRPLGGLFRVQDWAFSALRPMPNAAVFDADDAETAPVVASFDLAFWTGETVLAVRLHGSGTPSPREEEACDRLRAMGVHIVTIPARDLATGIEIFSESVFPDVFRSFWHGIAYPCSPFRPQGLPASLALG